jgi:hypothetical protein
MYSYQQADDVVESLLSGDSTTEIILKDVFCAAGDILTFFVPPKII